MCKGNLIFVCKSLLCFFLVFQCNLCVCNFCVQGQFNLCVQGQFNLCVQEQFYLCVQGHDNHSSQSNSLPLGSQCSSSTSHFVWCLRPCRVVVAIIQWSSALVLPWRVWGSLLQWTGCNLSPSSPYSPSPSPPPHSLSAMYTLYRIYPCITSASLTIPQNYQIIKIITPQCNEQDVHSCITFASRRQPWFDHHSFYSSSPLSSSSPSP